MAGRKKRTHIDISFDESKDNTSNPASSKLKAVVPLRQVALFPLPGDNCAVCTRRVDAGLTVIIPDDNTKDNKEGFEVKLSHSVLEGHRICAVKGGIKKGEPLLSWGLPFGYALRDIQPGIYSKFSLFNNTLNYNKYSLNRI